MNKLQTLWYRIDGLKTYAIAVITVFYALIVVGWQNHDWNGATELILGASGLGALRHGLTKAE